MFEFLNYTFVFLSIFIFMAACISFYAQSFSLTVLDSYLMFLVLTVETGYSTFEIVMIVSGIALTILGGFKIWNETFSGGNEI